MPKLPEKSTQVNQSNNEVVIAEIRKNATSIIRIILSDYASGNTVFRMFTLRAFYTEDGTTYKATKNGINLRAALLPEVIEALQQAEVEARNEGSLPEREDEQ